MILRHRDWDAEKKLKKEMTVKEFIKEIVLSDINKNKKYYRITTKESYNGKKNLILYCQNNKIKSHHSTGIEFNYKEVFDWNICPIYSEKAIMVEDIISMSLDFELKEVHKTYKIEEVHKITEKLFEELEQKDLEKNNRNKIFKNNVNEKDLIICIKQLVKDLEEQDFRNVELESKFDKCKERESNLQEQIKWLEYKFNNKT